MFDDIEIEYNGETRKIKSNEVLPLICRVERVVTLAELHQCMSDGKPPMATIAMAYGVVLRYAGFVVTDQQIYCDMFNQESASETAASAVSSLLLLMVPPQQISETVGKRATDKKKERSKIA